MTAIALWMPAHRSKERVDPATIRRNDGICSTTSALTSIAPATAANRYATLFFGLIDVPKQTMSYVNAGHNPPLIFRKSTAKPPERSVPESLDGGGPPVGLFARSQYQSGQAPLRYGDVLVAYTDGVVEALNSRQEEFGEERLCQAVQEFLPLPAAVISKRIQERLQAFTGDQPQFDDIALVVLKLNDEPTR